MATLIPHKVVPPQLIGQSCKHEAHPLANFCAISFRFKIENITGSSSSPENGKTFEFSCNSCFTYRWSIRYIKENEKVTFKLCCKSTRKDAIHASVKLLYQTSKITEIHKGTQECQPNIEYTICSYTIVNEDMDIIFKLAYNIDNSALKNKIALQQNSANVLREPDENFWSSPIVSLQNENGYKANVHKKCLDQIPVFAAMFSDERFKEAREKIAVIPFRSQVISSLLNFLYSGKFSKLAHVDMIQLLYCADKYQMDSLKEYAEVQLISTFVFDNTIELLGAAVDCNAKLLLEIIVRMALFFEMFETVEWRIFAKDQPHVVSECLNLVATLAVL